MFGIILLEVKTDSGISLINPAAIAGIDDLPDDKCQIVMFGGHSYKLNYGARIAALKIMEQLDKIANRVQDKMETRINFAHGELN